ncbi:MAG: hypothetical protein HYW25_00525 [Candidatus Aenigmarchaeota archaeon]|nr:hypothetical protein [Candidatus Aenigmarchaeota archaeon]
MRRETSWPEQRAGKKDFRYGEGIREEPPIAGYRWMTNVDRTKLPQDTQRRELPYTDEEIALRFAERRGVPVADIMVTASLLFPDGRAVYIKE